MKHPIQLTDDALFRRWKAHCAKTGESISEATANLIRDRLARPTSSAAAKEQAAKASAAARASLKAHAREKKPRPDGDVVDRLTPADVIDGLGAESIDREFTISVSADPSCRRPGCAHPKSFHARGDQGACAHMGCACPRFMPAPHAA